MSTMHERLDPERRADLARDRAERPAAPRLFSDASCHPWRAVQIGFGYRITDSTGSEVARVSGMRRTAAQDAAMLANAPDTAQALADCLPALSIAYPSGGPVPSAAKAALQACGQPAPKCGLHELPNALVDWWGITLPVIVDEDGTAARLEAVRVNGVWLTEGHDAWRFTAEDVARIEELAEIELGIRPGPSSSPIDRLVAGHPRLQEGG